MQFLEAMACLVKEKLPTSSVDDGYLSYFVVNTENGGTFTVNDYGVFCIDIQFPKIVSQLTFDIANPKFNPESIVDFIKTWAGENDG